MDCESVSIAFRPRSLSGLTYKEVASVEELKSLVSQ